MLGKSAKSQQRNHGPFWLLALALLAACESNTAPPGLVELTGQTRLRADGEAVHDVDVVVVRLSGFMPVAIVARTISDSTGTYRVTYDAVDPGTCGSYFAAARRDLHLGELQPNLAARVPCKEGVHNIDFILSSTDTVP